MNSVDVEFDEPIPPTEEGETSSEVSEVYYFHFFLLGGIVSYFWLCCLLLGQFQGSTYVYVPTV